MIAWGFAFVAGLVLIVYGDPLPVLPWIGASLCTCAAINLLAGFAGGE